MKTLNSSAPTQSHERIEIVDIMRGFALIGVLAMNMHAYSGHSFALREITDSLDKTTVIFLQFFFQAKFYSLFSFLFGWGMATQLARSKSRGTRFVPYYLRRNFILLGIGLIHAILIWNGDILVVYALLAILLVPFRNRSPKTILFFSVAFLTISIVMVLPGETMDVVRSFYNQYTNFLRQNTFPPELYATGSYPEILLLRKEQFFSMFSNILFWFGNIFSMFLLGLYVGKREIFKNIHGHLPLIRKVMWVGLFIGLIFNGIFVKTNLQPNWLPQTYHRLATSGARTIGAPALMLFYVCMIIMLVTKESWKSRLIPLAPVGKMALSNYLFQSVLCTLIFYGYGLGLYGEISPTVGLILTIFIFLGQIRFSSYWMERYQFGPMEWLWRSLTYLKRQPLRMGQTYADLRPSPYIQTVIEKFKQIPQKQALVGVWLILFTWAAGLVIWNNKLSSQGFDEPFTVVVKVTATPEGGVLDSPGVQKEQTPSNITTPVVESINYNPGQIAASGDMVSLATKFDVNAALTHIDTLAGQAYSGRYAGTSGGFEAGDYIAEMFASYGLQPAGDSGTFFQNFPIYINQLSDIPTLTVETAEGVRRKATLYRDFSPITSRYVGAGKTNGQVFWADQCSPEALQKNNLVGKVVFCQGIVNTDDILNTGRLALEYGAVGLLLLTDPETRSPDFGSRYYLPWVPETIPAFRVFPDIVDEILSGTGYNLDDLQNSLPPMQLETSATLELETTGNATCPTDGCLARNVLGVIPGRDPAYAHEVILIGGHYDHMGASPDGTIWYGADDNASGIAVLLEIARSWQEQGYVPRRTVLFAAWDAEELGLLGSIHYVKNPRYSLENTAAMVQLDMVGAGAEFLTISGDENLKSHILLTAEMLGVEAAGSDMGRSDHVPFQMAGVPANLIIWWDEATENHVHRTNDTPQGITPKKLEVAAHIADLTLLNLAESEPAILDMLARRATALETGDRVAYLATSQTNQKITDMFWFDDLQTLDPIEVDLNAVDLQILGDTARATIQFQVKHAVLDAEGSEDESRVVTANLDVQFVRESKEWLWSGPHLTAAPRDAGTPGFRVLYPPEAEMLPNLGELALEKYADIAGKLGLPTETDADLYILPTTEALRTNIAVSLPEGQNSWVAPGKIYLVYNPEIDSSELLTTTITQLVLANAGIPRNAAPWLWEGLSLLLRSDREPRPIQSVLLPKLALALEIYPSLVSTSFANEDDFISAIDFENPTTGQNDDFFSATSWAATEFLLSEYGWSGLGTIISKFGKSCKTSGCLTEADVEVAYRTGLQKGVQEFETAWQNQWRVNLEAIQSNLDTLLASRMEAALREDINSFLFTVDPSVPNLLTAERSWISNLIKNPPEELSIYGQPLTIYGDGLVLASVNLDVHEYSGRTEQLTYPVLVNMTDTNPLWMGIPLENLHGDRVDVRYPLGAESLAQRILTEADYELAEIAATLEISPTRKLTLELFDDPDSFRSSIFFSYPHTDRTAAWTFSGENIKLLVSPGTEIEDFVGRYQSELSSQIARWLLYQSGVDSEWLLKGVSRLITRPFDGGKTYQEAGAAYPEILAMLDSRALPKLSSLRQDYQLSQEEFAVVQSIALDSVRYLVETYGWNRLLNILHSYSKGVALDNAMQTTLGISLNDFEENWKNSLSQGHIAIEWYEITQNFNRESAISHIDNLTSAEMKGRQAGTSGDRAAQAYIAEQFAAFGLFPGGNSEGTSYFQQFNITTTIMTAVPNLKITGNETLDFIFREDFSPIRGLSVEVNQVSGELVWVDDYNALEFGEVLSDTIVVRPATTEIDFEIEQAVNHGAVGLIFVSDAHGNQIYAKQPEIYAFPPNSPIPVFELTRSGTGKFLEASNYTSQSFIKIPPITYLEILGEMEFTLPTAETLPTTNVLGFLPGSDPFLKQEVIIIGAHYDHVGDDPSNGLRFSGGNDNASGISGLLEIARIWLQDGYHPKRSILFAAWGAQELEQAGSRYYAENPIYPLENTVGMIQMDGIAGGDGFYPGIQGEWQTDGQLLLRMRTDDKLIITPQTTPSDHFSFHDYSFPTLLVSWRLANEDNLPDDIAIQVSSERFEICVKMVILALMGIAR